jgi:hypothetical protein
VSTHPEPVVSEATGREAIDRVAQSVRETQIAAGVPIPDGAVDWAREVVRDTIRKHEERAANPAPQPVLETDPAEHPCRINKGEVGEGTDVLARDLEQSARGRRHLRDTRSLETLLLEGRLELLRYFPCEPGCTGPAKDAGHVHPWNQKLIQSVDDAVVWTRKSGWTDDDPRTTQRLCDEMMKVVDKSGMPLEMGGLGLGDYRTLRREMYVRLPRRGGLVPISQIPKHAPPLAIAVDASDRP